MDKLSVSLENCYGIKKLNYEFDFTKGNVVAIYARNGLMKTSFAKTMKKIQLGEKSEIKDEIFRIDGIAQVKVDDSEVTPDKIFVVNSFESAYQADVTPLLINESIKNQLKEVLKARDKLLKALEKDSGVKIKRTSNGKIIYELESTISRDFGFKEDSLLMNLRYFKEAKPEFDLAAVTYASIFDDSVIKKILSDDFQSKIHEYANKSTELYNLYTFLSKGKLTLPKLKNVQKSLKNEKYFSQENAIILSGKKLIGDEGELANQITEIENDLKEIPAFKSIEKSLSDAKGSVLKDIIELNPEIIEWLTEEKLPDLRKCLWISYINKNLVLFNELYEKFTGLSKEIDSVEIDSTPWKNALQIYEKRFSVPYKMQIENLKGAVIGESIPKVEFSFSNGNQIVNMNRDKLDELNTLSQGEKRALYLLNIIFDIEEIKRKEGEVIFIVDDIADSFDYKNKYAIVEYLYEIAQDNRFYMIILSHNFDFYRTISSRLGLGRKNRLCASVDKTGIVLTEEYYQNQPFEYWKKYPTQKNVIAMIPFVRNLIEYGIDRHVFAGDNQDEICDFDLLTTLLHEKEKTNDRCFKDLLKIYREYLGICGFEDDVNLDDFIVPELYKICDELTEENAELENKILLAMAIRHKAETFMKNKLNAYTGQLSWRKNRRTNENGSSKQFLLMVEKKGNQTRELLNGYKQFGTEVNISILENVAIMTPENIHLNSFMYEPIMDMDIVELLDLYKEIKEIEEELTNG